MASLFITELNMVGGVPSLPPLRNQIAAISTAVSTAAIGADAYAVGLQSDAGCMVVVGSSGSTGLPTSTSGVRIGAGLAPQYFAVRPYSRIAAIST